jgi:hypothetical protein
MIFSPLSEIPSFGRLNVYMVTFFIFMILQIPTGTTNQSWLFARGPFSESFPTSSSGTQLQHPDGHAILRWTRLLSSLVHWRCNAG